MDTIRQGIPAECIRISLREKGAEHGHAYLYILRNDSHHEPYGYIEDVFVDPDMRGQGLGSRLLDILMEEAVARGCYKITCTSERGCTFSAKKRIPQSRRRIPQRHILTLIHPMRRRNIFKSPMV